MSLDIDIGKHFSANYTHNVTPMWERLGCYNALYKSDGKRAKNIRPYIEHALILADSETTMSHLREMNPKNGWGDADRAVKWLVQVYIACVQHPNAKVRISA